MPPPDASRELYRTLQRLQLVMVATGRRAWSRMRPDFDPAWAEIAPGLVTVTAAAQLAAARSAVEYVPRVLEETGQPDEPLASVRPQAFSGVASDGRSLSGLLAGSVVAAKRAARGTVLRDGLVTRYFPGVGAEKALAVGGQWLETALQSAVSDAARDATAASIVARPHMGWTRMANPPCCSRCAVLAGAFYRWNTGFQRHPRCFPAGVVVSGPGHEAATRRWYQGELVVLTTASGQDLSLTGNHPVLTSRGWVPANLLNEGAEVVRSTRPEGAHSLVVPDHHEVPSRIEDVWGALSVTGLSRVPSTPEDFHGDGQHGEVDVVRADRALSLGTLSVAEDHASQQRFARGIGQSLRLDPQRTTELVDLWHPAFPGGLIGGLGLGSAFVGGHVAHADQPRLPSSSPLHAGRYESFADRAARESVLAGECQFAGAGFVGGDDFRHGELDPPRWDAPGLAFSVETREGYASRGLDLLDRLTGQVELDRVVKLRRVEWSGHVYSLTSVEGWHSANSLIVSNCDCLHIPTQENRSGDFLTDPNELVKRGLITDLTPAQKARIDDGHDLVKVLNESRDRWRERMAADRRARGPVDRLGRSRTAGWAGGGSNPPPVGTTIHELLDRLTSQVDAARAMRAAGIAD